MTDEQRATVQAFLDTWVEPGNGRDSVHTDDMHRAYEHFCRAGGVQPLGIVAFGMEMFQRGYRTSVDILDDDTTTGRKTRSIALRRWQGLRLRSGVNPKTEGQ